MKAKRTILSITFTLLVLISTGCSRQFTLTGTIEGGGLDTLFVLCEALDTIWVEEAIARDGAFSLTFDPERVESVTLFTARSTTSYPFLVREQTACTLHIAADSVATVAVAGDPEAVRYYDFRARFAEIKLLQRDSVVYHLDTLLRNDSMQVYQALVTTDTFRVVDASLATLTRSFLDQNSHSPYAVLALGDYLATTHRYTDFYDWIRAHARAKQPPVALSNRLYIASQRGVFSLTNRVLPDFSYTDFAGSYRNIAAFRRSSGMVLLFWDPNDAYSRYVVKQMTSLVVDLEKKIKAWEKKKKTTMHSNQKFTFVSIAVTENPNEWKHLVDSLKLKGVQGNTSPLREMGLIDDYELHTLPSLYVTTRGEDKVKYTNIYGDSLANVIDRLLFPE